MLSCRMLSSLGFVASLGVALTLTQGCSTEGKKDIARSALESMGPEERRESFEATARVLDEQPALVDELYAVVRQHRPTMFRFLTNASRDLREPWLADMTAERLVEHPDSVERTLLSATDAIAREPKARKAMNRAVAQRADKTVDILTDDPDTLARVLAASLATIERKPRARENVLAAARQERQRIIAFVKSDPELSKELTEELLREAVKDKPALEKLLRATGAIDEDAPAPKKAKPKR
ncbi:MAG: hypothetical protein K0S65_5741 [Labilithrix sp.]|nr:hypothetical protein [Labilithrix sp.]